MSIDFTDLEKRDLGISSLSKESNPKQSKKKVSCITFSLNNPIQIKYAIKVMENEFKDFNQNKKNIYITFIAYFI